jgi:hypothetical protein
MVLFDDDEGRDGLAEDTEVYALYMVFAPLSMLGSLFVMTVFALSWRKFKSHTGPLVCFVFLFPHFVVVFIFRSHKPLQLFFFFFFGVGFEGVCFHFSNFFFVMCVVKDYILCFGKQVPISCLLSSS